MEWATSLLVYFAYFTASSDRVLQFILNLNLDFKMLYITNNRAKSRIIGLLSTHHHQPVVIHSILLLLQKALYAPEIYSRRSSGLKGAPRFVCLFILYKRTNQLTQRALVLQLRNLWNATVVNYLLLAATMTERFNLCQCLYSPNSLECRFILYCT